MKGQSPLIGYLFTVLFSILVLAGMSLLIYSFYANAIQQEVRSELTQIATGVKDTLSKVYDLGKNSNSQPVNQSSILIAEVPLNLPKKIANLNYEVDLITANKLFSYIQSATLNGTNITGVKSSGIGKIVAKTTQDPEISIEFDLPNIDATIQGKVINGVNDVLKYYRNNENATIYDTVILGQSDIIIRITSIS